MILFRCNIIFKNLIYCIRCAFLLKIGKNACSNSHTLFSIEVRMKIVLQQSELCVLLHSTECCAFFIFRRKFLKRALKYIVVFIICLLCITAVVAYCYRETIEDFFIPKSTESYTLETTKSDPAPKKTKSSTKSKKNKSKHKSKKPLRVKQSLHIFSIHTRAIFTIRIVSMQIQSQSIMRKFSKEVVMK